MGNAIKILMIEDSEDDALLILRELRRGGYEPETARVQDRAGVLKALGEPWDLILCDYVLPSFNALNALTLYHEAGLDIPFIVVSGNIGEDIAVAAMKAGAHDYIMKNNLARLVPAIEREIKESGERRKRRAAEEDVKLAKHALDQAGDLISWFDLQGYIIYANDAACEGLGFSRDEMIGMNVMSMGNNPDVGASLWENFLIQLRQKGSRTVEMELKTKTGTVKSFEISTSLLEFEGKQYIYGIARDISERKRAEKIRQELAAERDRLLEQLQNVLEQMPIGCILGDEEFRATFWNPAAEKIFGYKREEMLGKVPHETITPQSLHPMLKSMKQKLKRDAGVGIHSNINENITKDGRKILCEWHDVSLKSPEGAFVGHLAMAQDITDHIKNEEAILRHSARVEALLRVAARLNSNLDLKALLEQICREVQNVLGANSITVSFYDESDDTLRRVTGIGELPGREGKPIPRSIFGEIIEKRVLVVRDIQENHVLDINDLRALNLHTAVFASMTYDDKFIGCINAFYQGPPRDVTEDEQKFLKGLADHAALAIANAQLFEQIFEGQERMRHLNSQVMTAQEEERRRLSRELHDETGQALTALKIYLELILDDLPESFAPVRVRIEEAAALAGATLEQIRLLAQALRPPALDTLGVNAALEDYCRDFSRRTRIAVIYNGLETSSLNDTITICLYRFLQEALTNVAKHAHAKQVEVRLMIDDGQFSLTIKDDGKGMANSESGEKSKGLGLLGMKERLEALGGRLIMESEPGHGTCLTAQIPLEDEL